MDGHGSAIRVRSRRESVGQKVGGGKRQEERNMVLVHFFHLTLPLSTQTPLAHSPGVIFSEVSFREGCCGMEIPQV